MTLYVHDSTCIASMTVVALIPHQFDKHYQSIRLYTNMYWAEYRSLH